MDELREVERAGGFTAGDVVTTKSGKIGRIVYLLNNGKCAIRIAGHIYYNVKIASLTTAPPLKKDS